MITPDEVAPIGALGKAHGIAGEINFHVDDDVDVEELSCIIMKVDGIFVPFYINTIRERGNGSYLITISGIETEAEVSAYVNSTVYALVDELGDVEGEEDGEGFYAADLIGYKVDTSDGVLKGEIIDIDDTTDNVLFVVRTEDGRQVLVPVVDEFIQEIDAESRHIVFDLPEGLVSL